MRRRSGEGIAERVALDVDPRGGERGDLRGAVRIRRVVTDAQLDEGDGYARSGNGDAVDTALSGADVDGGEAAGAGDHGASALATIARHASTM